MKHNYFSIYALDTYKYIQLHLICGSWKNMVVSIKFFLEKYTEHLYKKLNVILRNGKTKSN